MFSVSNPALGKQVIPAFFARILPLPVEKFIDQKTTPATNSPTVSHVPITRYLNWCQEPGLPSPKQLEYYEHASVRCLEDLKIAGCAMAQLPVTIVNTISHLLPTDSQLASL